MRFSILFIYFLIPLALTSQSPCDNLSSISYNNYEYELIEIGDQCWFKENLKTVSFQNGTNINNIEDSLEWLNSVNSPGYTTHNYDSNIESTHGFTYNWWAITSTSNVCPLGYKIPSNTDFLELIESSGGINSATNLKDNDTWEGTNFTNFSATPNGKIESGEFNYLDQSCHLWTYSNNKLITEDFEDQESDWGYYGAIGPTFDILQENNGNYYVQTGFNGTSNGYISVLHTNSIDLNELDLDSLVFDVRISGTPCNYTLKLKYSNYPIGGSQWINSTQTLYSTSSLYEPGEPITWKTIEIDIGNLNPSPSGQINFGWILEQNCTGGSTYVPDLQLDNFILKLNGINPTSLNLYSNSDLINLNLDQEKTEGLSVRCLKDQSFVYISGCTDNDACNFNPQANQNDFSCLYPGNSCDDNDANTINDTYNSNCICSGTPITYGCTIPQACNYNDSADIDNGSCLFIGEPCDDGYQATTNDVIQADCSCQGTIIEGCTYPNACNFNPEATVLNDSCLFPGDSCDDQNSNTINDAFNSNCEFVGETAITGCTDNSACNYDINATSDDGSCIFFGDSCDDGDSLTENDTYNIDCECQGVPIEIVLGCTYESACNYNPEANQNDESCLFEGDPCDDNDLTTGADAYNESCECEGTPLVGGCTYAVACNYDPSAEYDNNTCIFIGDSCDDQNPETSNDIIQDNCECEGEVGHVSINDLKDFSVLIYPNPSSTVLNIDLGEMEGSNTTINLYDTHSKIIYSRRTSTLLTIDVTSLSKGIYTLELVNHNRVLRSHVVIE